MNENKMFLIFDRLEKFHLSKDVGELPLALKKYANLDISVLSCLKKFNDEYSEEIPLLFFDVTSKKLLNKFIMYLYVLFHCRKLKYLMTFHYDIDKLLLFYLCKIINPRIITYFKLDMDEPTALYFLKRYVERHDSSVRKWKYKIKKYLSKKVDLFTIETKSCYKILNQDPIFKEKLFYLPNGFNAEKPYDFSIKKEKMIITVGRIGTPQKHSELLLDAIENLESTNGYTFYFIGPVEKNFQDRYNKLINRRPDLKDKIILTGNVINRDELYSYYKKAEFLCVTSIYESFHLVITEGLYFGCYLLSTDIGTSFDIVSENNRKIITINKELFYELQQKGIRNIVEYVNSNYAEILKSEWHKSSVLKLSEVLNEAISRKIITINSCKDCSDSVYNNFNWNIIAKNLYNLLNGAKS